MRITSAWAVLTGVAAFVLTAAAPAQAQAADPAPATVRPATVSPAGGGLAAVSPAAASSAGRSVAAADVSGFRYWSYYHLADDGWEYSQVRMDTHVPDDGAVEGWRFVTAEFGDESRTPRAEVTFDDVCADVAPAAGQKRVGLVIDYGRAADAAEGDQPPQARVACAAVDEDATTAMALSAVAELRLDDTRMCGVDGYPARGCNETVDPLPEEAADPDDVLTLSQVAGVTDADPGGPEGTPPATTETATDDAGESSAGAGVWIGVAVALAVTVGAVIVVRRSRRSSA